MGGNILKFVLLLGFGFATLNAKSLPKFITKCKRSDPQLGECIKAQVKNLQPRLLKGIPELQIPPYDPMEIPELRLEQGTKAVKFRADFRNVTTHGAKGVRIDAIKVGLDKPRIDIHLYFPKLRITTHYELNGKVLLLPVRGNGNSEGNFTDVYANVTLTGHYNEKTAQKFVSLTGREVHLRIGGAQMYFDNFFNGNKELIESTNKFINQNWKDIIKELQPVLEESIATLVFELVRHVFESYPIDELLPP